MKTTNYYNTFIQAAEDCPVTIAQIPPQKNNEKTAISIQYEMVKNNPYHYTSDEVIFNVHALRNNINEEVLNQEKERFFSKGQPCFRSSPLAKRYGWGVHSNAEGKIAIYPIQSEEYKSFTQDKSLKVIKAMRSKRA